MTSCVAAGLFTTALVALLLVAAPAAATPDDPYGDCDNGVVLAGTYTG